MPELASRLLQPNKAVPPPVLSRLAAWLTLNAGWLVTARWLAKLYDNQVRRLHGQPFNVRTDDGVSLHALYVPAAEDAPARLPIVMMHGWIEIKEFYLHRAEVLAGRGHPVVMFDHRGHGRSARSAATFGARERQDLQEVMAEARQRGYIGERVITMGHSMGAATALQEAADDPSVVGVVASAPYVDLRTAVCSFKDRLPLLRRISKEWAWSGFEHQLGCHDCCLDDTDTLAAVSRLHQPVLIIEGGRDTLTPPALHSRTLAHAKRHGELDVLRIDDADHITLVRREWPGLHDRIAEFCAKLA